LKQQKAWYVVYRGREPGVHATWVTCHAQVTGFKNFYYKSFPSKEEAVVESYMEFKGCKDDKVFVNPAATVVAKPYWIFPVCMVQSFLLLALIFYNVKCGKNCL
jgi:hypothetical protein